MIISIVKARRRRLKIAAAAATALLALLAFAPNPMAGEPGRHGGDTVETLQSQWARNVASGHAIEPFGVDRRRER